MLKSLSEVMPLPVQAAMGVNAAAVEPMDLGDEAGDAGAPREQPLAEDHLVYNPTLDLEQYANNYKGLARIHRLLYVADHCPLLRMDALLMALNYVQTHTYNWQMYQQIHAKLTQLSNGPDVVSNSDGQRQVPPYDAQWVEQIMKKGSMKLDKLDTDLKHYKSNSIKESIRRGQDDLGEHYLDMGELMNALKCFSRARDYCTSSKHIISMCYNVIKVSAYSQNWSLVLSYVNRAEATPELSQPQTGKDATTSRLQALSKLKCAAGLAELANKKYKAAAKQFLQVSFDHLDYPELVSASNVAIYGSLCALASLDRHELQKTVIGNAGFKQFLEIEPQMNEVIMKFYESKYASCLKLLDEIKDNLLIDLYLAPHVNVLYSMIRNRGLIQYFSPYLSADMRRMASAFNTSVGSLEDELMQLILDGQIKARIDSHNKIMYAKDVDQRASTYEKALAAGKAIQQRTKALVLRTAIQRANICVKVSSKETNAVSGNEITVTPTNSGPSSPH